MIFAASLRDIVPLAYVKKKEETKKCEQMHPRYVHTYISKGLQCALTAINASYIHIYF